MASSAFMPATRLSAPRISKVMECAKYSARLTNPNAIQITMINTEPRSRRDERGPFPLPMTLVAAGVSPHELRSPQRMRSLGAPASLPARCVIPDIAGKDAGAPRTGDFRSRRIAFSAQQSEPPAPNMRFLETLEL